MPDKNYEREICPECGGKIDYNNSIKCCSECGLEIGGIGESEYDYEDSSYIFNDINNKSNLNKQYVALGERTDYIGGLGTFIDYENSKYLRDKTGKLLPTNEQKLYRRLKKNYEKFLRIKNHETEYRVFNILNKVSIYLKLNKNIRNNAAFYYRKIVKKEKKVLNNISLIAFCIFYSVRREYHYAPITISEISNAFQKFGHRVSPRLILRDGIRYKTHLNDKSIPHNSEDYLIRLIDNVMNHEALDARLVKKGIIWSKDDYKNKLTDKCRFILKRLTKWDRGGRNPFILTGAIIYLADKLLSKEFNQKALLTQKIVSVATNITEYSIRDHYINLLKPIFIQRET